MHGDPVDRVKNHEHCYHCMTEHRQDFFIVQFFPHDTLQNMLIMNSMYANLEASASIILYKVQMA